MFVIYANVLMYCTVFIGNETKKFIKCFFVTVFIEHVGQLMKFLCTEIFTCHSLTKNNSLLKKLGYLFRKTCVQLHLQGQYQGLANWPVLDVPCHSLVFIFGRYDLTYCLLCMFLLHWLIQKKI